MKQHRTVVTHRPAASPAKGQKEGDDMTIIKDDTLIKIRTMRADDLKQVDEARPEFLQGFVEVHGWISIYAILQNTETGAVRKENMLDHVARKNPGLTIKDTTEAINIFREKTPQLFLR